MNWTEYFAQLAIAVIVPIIAGGFTLRGITRNNNRAKAIRDEDLLLEKQKEEQKDRQASFQMQLNHIADFLQIMRDETNSVNQKILDASNSKATRSAESIGVQRIKQVIVDAKVDFYMQVLKACEVLDLYITEPKVYRIFHEFFYLVDDHWHGLQTLLKTGDYEKYRYRMENELTLPEQAISKLQELRSVAREQLSLSTFHEETAVTETPST